MGVSLWKENLRQREEIKVAPNFWFVWGFLWESLMDHSPSGRILMKQNEMDIKYYSPTRTEIQCGVEDTTNEDKKNTSCALWIWQLFHLVIWLCAEKIERIIIPCSSSPHHSWLWRPTVFPQYLSVGHQSQAQHCVWALAILDIEDQVNFTETLLPDKTKLALQLLYTFPVVKAVNKALQMSLDLLQSKCISDMLLPYFLWWQRYLGQISREIWPCVFCM